MTLMRKGGECCNYNHRRRQRSSAVLFLPSTLRFSTTMLLSLLLLVSVSLSLAQNSDSGTAVVSGVAFLDSNADGKHNTDTTTEKGVGGTSIWLFSCDAADNYFSGSSTSIPTFPLLKTTETNTLGQYTFNNIIANNVNQYYINVQTPGWYTSTPQWDETAMTVIVEDEGGIIVGGIPGVNSVDPNTGNTPCFVLQPNEERIVDIGLVFDVPSDLVIGTIKPTATTPTVVNVDDKAEEVTLEPTSSPVIKVTTSSPSSAPEETTTIVVPNPNNTDNNEQQQTEQPSPPTTKPITTPTIIVVPSDPSNTNNDNSSNNNDEGGTGVEMIDNGSDTAITTTQSPSPSIITSSTTESPSPSTTTGTTSLTNEDGTTITTPTNNNSTEIATQSPTTSGQDEDKEDDNEEEIVLVDDDDDVLSEPYTMILRGITDIEEIDAWMNTTVLHIEQYFIKNENVFNVTVEIFMYDKDQQQMQRQWMTMRRWLQDEDVAAAEVMYQQKTTYQTSNPELYNESYIAKEPFINDQNSYIESLQQLSPYYDDVTSLEVSETLPTTLGDNIDPTMTSNEADDNNNNGSSMSNTMLGIIFGSVSGGILLLAGLTLFIYKFQSQKNKDKEYMSSVGNCLADDLESARDDDTEDTTRCVNGAAAGMGALSAIGAVAVASSARGGGGTGAVSQSPPTTSNVMLKIIIPPGIAGIVLDTRPGVRGCAYVCKIKNNCPIKDQIQLEDRIIAVDDEDVQTMNAVKLSKLLSKRSGNAQQNITVLRRVVNTDGNVGGGNQPLMLSNDQLIEDRATNEGETIDVIAPSGKLGIILVDPESTDIPGPAFVFNIRDDGPLVDMVKLGDRIIAIDDVDVRTMSAENVSKLLGSKNSKPQRKISILRVNSNESQQTSPEVSPRIKAKNIKGVAIRAEIITLCAAMNFPTNQRDDMLEQYVSREEELLQNLKQRKAVLEKGK